MADPAGAVANGSLSILKLKSAVEGTHIYKLLKTPITDEH